MGRFPVTTYYIQMGLLQGRSVAAREKNRHIEDMHLPTQSAHKPIWHADMLANEKNFLKNGRRCPRVVCHTLEHNICFKAAPNCSARIQSHAGHPFVVRGKLIPSSYPAFTT